MLSIGRISIQLVAAIAKDCPHVAIAATNWIEIRPIESMAQVRAAAAAG